MSLLVRMWPRPRRGGRTLVFSVDRPRRIDRVIDYFGDRLVPVMVSGPRGHAVSAREATGFGRRLSMIPSTGVRRG
jgi:hypothetical protein